jgi:hypothetical protein
MELNYINFIKDGEFNISNEYWNALNTTYTKDQIKLEMLKAIRIYNIPLPFSKPTVDQVIKDFNNLIVEDSVKIENYEYWHTRYDYKWPLEYEDINNFIYLNGSNAGLQASNYYHMDNRLACDSINSPSPIRVWNNDKFMLTLMNYFWSGLITGSITMSTFKQAIGMRKYIASQFKPSVAKYIYNRYAPNGVVLDFSSGWGDRLTGFYASSAKEYIGIDPNKNLIAGYNDQITMYNSICKDKSAKMLPWCAEDVTLGEKVDLIFTSCPYFNIERYTQDADQSFKKFKKLDDWLAGFLFESIRCFWVNLKEGGHMIINISDVYSNHTINHICDPMNDYINTLKGSEYQGALGLRMAKRPNTNADKEGIFAEPMWVWKKGSI